MKRLALILATLTLAVAPVAVGAPDPVPNPEDTFVVTRILPNQRETTLETFTLTEGWTTSSVIVQTVVQFARTTRINNPAWVIVIYGPTNGGLHTNDDRIWDSRTDL